MSSLIPSSITSSLSSLLRTTPTQSLIQGAQDPVEEAYKALEQSEDRPATVLQQLDIFSSDVNGVIINETQTPGVNFRTRPRVDVALKIFTLIENARNNCCMDSQWEDLKPSAKNFLGNISLLIDELKKNKQDNLSKIESDVQRLVGALKTNYYETQITGSSPQYLYIPPEATKVKVSIFGEFHFSNSQVPILKKGNSEIKAKGLKKNVIDFEVPVSMLAANDQDKNAIFKYVKVNIVAPWESGFPGWKKVHQATFSVWLGVLPKSPGEIKVTYRKISQGERICRLIKSPTNYWLSSALDTISQPNLTFKSTEGWEFTKLPEVVMEESIPNVHPHCQQMDNCTCVVSFKLNNNLRLFKPVFFHLKYEEALIKDREERVEIIQNLFWNNMKKISPGRNEEISGIVLKDFNGLDVKFSAGTNISHPFLQVYSNEDSTILATDSSHCNDANFVNLFRSPSPDEVIESVASTLNRVYTASVFTRFNEVISPLDELNLSHEVHQTAFTLLQNSFPKKAFVTTKTLGEEEIIVAREESNRSHEAERAKILASHFNNDRKEKETLSSLKEWMSSNLNRSIDSLPQIMKEKAKSEEKEEKE